MFNVLPDIFKKEIKSEYHLRRFIVVSILIIFLQISFLIFIFPSWLSSFYREKDVSAQIESQKSGVVSRNASDILQTIGMTNQNVSIIDNNFNYQSFLTLVKNIISYKTSAISLTEFTYDNSTNKSSVPMSISGVAKGREDLVGFVKKLQDSGQFSDVVSPISNLAKDKNIDFVINLKTK